ncbi:MAG: hypothetical protein Q8Q88_14780 [Phenylobacterium sp.]|uniref:hypothetical protein n=1 Tax=Phenylobacterium sp. TaxID=1871053 RepID=UPI002733AA48|nr:hypothetical protein [Phenylobacterium sp.]MDP3748302.1 hypothetical protein [Phenylobacterium sp.]
MGKVNDRDRELLARALRDGGLSVVTHRRREALAAGVIEHRRLNRLCNEGLLEQDSVQGDRYASDGELRYDYRLTAKGARAAG